MPLIYLGVVTEKPCGKRVGCDDSVPEEVNTLFVLLSARGLNQRANPADNRKVAGLIEAMAVGEARV
jgi:hypothetical protein